MTGLRRCSSCPSRYVAYELTFRSLDPPTGVRVALYCRRCWHVFLQVLDNVQGEADHAADEQRAREIAAADVAVPAPTRIGANVIARQVRTPKHTHGR